MDDLLDELHEIISSGLDLGEATSELGCRHPHLPAATLDTLMWRAEDDIWAAKGDMARCDTY